MSKIKKAINRVTIGYVIVALIYQIVWLIAPIRAFLFDSGLDIFSSGLAMLGFALLVWDLITDRVFWQSKTARLLVLVIAVLCLSSLVNYNYGISKNAKVLIWQMVQMLVMFPLCYRIREELHGVFLSAVHAISSAVIIPAVLVSLYQFCYLIFYNIDIDGSATRQGFQGGRLFGVFASIYFACLFCAMLCIVSVYLARKTKNTLLRVLYSVESIICLIYIILSDTRSVQVGLITVIFVAVFVIAKGSRRISDRISNKLLKSGLCVILACLAVVCSMGVYNFGSKALKKIPQYLASADRITDTSPDGDQGGGKAPTTEKDPSADTDPDKNPSVDPDDKEYVEDDMIDSMLDRTDTTLDNISNGRFEIWHDYITVTLSNVKAILFGYGPGSYMDAIRENYPDAFIVGKIKEYYPAMYDRGLIYDTHNAYLSVFVTAGVIGVLAMGVFLLYGAVKMFRYLLCTSRPSGAVLTLSMILIMILVAVFFDSDMFFKCTDTSMIFWIASGFLLVRIDGEMKKNKTEDILESEQTPPQTQATE